MTNTARALNAFWNGFGLPAYPEDNVPETDARGNAIGPPYITYTLEEPEWDSPASHQARVWFRGEGYEAIDAKVDEIAAAIPAGCGAMLPTGGGYLWLNRAGAWVQMQPTDERHLKAAQLNMELRAYTV